MSAEREPGGPSTEGFGDCCIRVIGFPEKFLSSIFYNYGKMVARNPWPVLIVSFLIQALLVLGLLRIVTDEFKQEDTVTAFLARGTWIGDSRDWFLENWPVTFDNYWPAHLYDLPEMFVLYVQARNVGDNVLDAQGIAEIFQFCGAFETVTANVGGEDLTYSDVCATWKESCQRAFACSGLLQTAPQFSPPYITSALLPILSISNEVVSNETVRLLANNSLVPEEQVSGASHIVLYWYTYKTSQAEEWSEKVFGQLDEMRKGFTNANYYLYSYAKGRQEDTENLENDLPLLGAGAGLLIVYCVLATFNMKFKGHRLPLTLLGIFSTALSLGAAFGVMIGAQVPFIALSAIIPFVVSGIGIDAILVLSTEWANLWTISNPVERVGLTMERSFMGVSLSHLTSLLAFLVGMISPFPAVDYLCGYMAVCITLAWFGEGTFFLACLCLHGRWAREHKGDQNGKTYVVANGKGNSKKQHQTEDEPDNALEKPVLDFNSTPSEVCSTNRDISIIESVLMWILPRFVVNKYIKCVIIFGLGVGLGLAIISVYNIPREEFYSIYYKEDSSIGEFYDARRNDYPFPVILQCVFDKQLDYSNNATRQIIEDFFADLTATGYFEKMETNWLSMFEQFYTPVTFGLSSQIVPIAEGNETAYTRQVNTFLNAYLPSPNLPVFAFLRWLADDVRFNDDLTKITVARFYINLIESTSGAAESNEKILDSLKAVLDMYGDSLNPHAYSFVLSELERNVLLRGEVWISISIVAVVAIVVTLFFIPSFTVYILVLLSFFAAMLSAMGLMGAWDLTYSLSTYVEIMLGFGLCIDYMAHMARGFMVAEGSTPQQRVRAALSSVGVAMSNAVLTSVLGIVMLGAAASFANRSFFRSMFLIFLCSYLFGVWLLPAVLSVAAPQIAGRQTRKTQKSNAQFLSKEAALPTGINEKPFYDDDKYSAYIEAKAEENPNYVEEAF